MPHARVSKQTRVLLTIAVAAVTAIAGFRAMQPEYGFSAEERAALRAQIEREHRVHNHAAGRQANSALDQVVYLATMDVFDTPGVAVSADRIETYLDRVVSHHGYVFFEQDTEWVLYNSEKAVNEYQRIRARLQGTDQQLEPFMRPRELPDGW